MQQLRDIILDVSRVEVRDRVSYAGQACTLALASWLAETADERQEIMDRSAYYDLSEEVAMLVRVLDTYDRPRSGGRIT